MTVMPTGGFPRAPLRDRAAAPVPAPMTARRYHIALAAAVAAGIVLLTILFAPAVVRWRFGDPDDIMRLLEVKDWLAGQSWFDVTQYRINPPAGLAMHWSRILDVPLGVVILLARPWVGEARAEQLACMVVPMITFALLALLIAAITRRVLNSRPLALVAALFTAIDIGTVSIARPMRIDHHGWQAVCGLGMALALISPRTVRRAAVAGLCAAFWMHISLEGIVFTACCAAWLGMNWLWNPRREGATLPAFMAATTAGSLAFFLIAHGGALFDRTYCDAISPLHMIVFAIAAVGATAALCAGNAPLPVRAAALGAVAAMCAATYRLGAPQCAGGPFAQLTPLTYRLWYLNVGEGLPIWRQTPAMAAAWSGFPFLALAWALLWLCKASVERRAAAVDYAAILAFSTVIGLMLCRASALSNLMAIPGALMLTAMALPRIERVAFMPARVFATAVVAVLTIPLVPCIAAVTFLSAPRDGMFHADGIQCVSVPNLAHMNALPPGLVMAPLDISEALVYASRQRAVGAGYHRNIVPMEDVLRFFTGDDATSHGIARRRHVDYVLICPDIGDALKLARAAPHGLAARLERGAPSPSWLKPVVIPGLHGGHVYRVIG